MTFLPTPTASETSLVCPYCLKQFLNVKSCFQDQTVKQQGLKGHQGDHTENIQRQRLKPVEAQPAPSSMFPRYSDEDN